MKHGVWPDQLAMGYEVYFLLKDELDKSFTILGGCKHELMYYAGIEIHVTLNRCGCKVYNKFVDKMKDSKNKA